MINKRLGRDFFARPTIEVAQELVGKELVFHMHKGIITETEAYVGQNDPACHAARGLTKRTEVMFGPPGYSYVYLIYGMYYCLNFVTEAEGFPAAVLIRGICLDNISRRNLDGPGKLCKFLGITKEHNKIDITTHEHFYVNNTDLKLPYNTTSRIGISKGKELLWRFVVN